MTTKSETKSNLVVAARLQSRGAISVTVLGIVALIMFGAVSMGRAAVITVNEDGSGDYTDIPEAVYAANPYDTILVAAGEYTGADLFGPWGVAPGIKVRGSGPSTRIVRPGFEIWNGPGWMIWACSIYIDDGEISNLTIDLEGVGSDDFVYGIDIGGSNPTVKYVTIEGATYGISCWDSDNPHVEGSSIIGQAVDLGILCWNSPAGNICDNTVSGSCRIGVLADGSEDTVVTGNAVSGTCRYGLYSYMSDRMYISDNVVSGTGRIAILMNDVFDCSVVSNMIQSLPDVAAIYLQMSHGCHVSGNALIDVHDPEQAIGSSAGGVHICRWGRPSTDNIVHGNDYTQSGLPGLKKDGDGPLCVVLDEGTQGNLVKEQGGFPQGTNAKTQVFDGGSGDGTTANRVVGHDAHTLAQQKDLNPGIGQRLKAAAAAIAAPPEPQLAGSSRLE